MLVSRIAGVLNNGQAVAAEAASPMPDTRCFVLICPRPSPGIPREERRYLNSKYSMWQYWDFVFRRIVLRPGWESMEDDWDMFCVQSESVVTNAEAAFLEQLAQWVPDPTKLVPAHESECPV